MVATTIDRIRELVGCSSTTTRSARISTRISVRLMRGTGSVTAMMGASTTTYASATPTICPSQSASGLGSFPFAAFVFSA